jgi:hypothetical protein
MRLTRPFIVVGIVLLAISPLLAAFVGSSIGSGILHPMRLNAMRREDTQKMLARTGATKEDFGRSGARRNCAEGMESAARFSERRLGSAVPRRV